jgi:tetratricopeptide (TPR) repeat protein
MAGDMLIDMEGSPERAGARKLILLLCFAVTATVWFQAIRIWLADYRVHTNRIDQMERGLTIEPQNAAGWDRLGRIRQTDFENPDPAAAVVDFQNAVKHDPGMAQYWIDLAGGYEAIGNVPLALEAFQRARYAYPASAQVAWSYGNFLLRQNDPAEGFAQINQAMRTDPRLVPLAVSRIWHSTKDANLLVDKVLPADANSYLEAIDFMASADEAPAALVVWQRLLTLGERIELPRAFPLLELLIRTERAEDASRVWREALAAAGLPHDEPANHSLIWNGDFAKDFENGGLDWRWNPLSGASIDFDAPPPSGGRSIRLEFNGGANLDLMQPKEFVPVEPSRRYHFHAKMRTERISTEMGILFSITDPNHAGAVAVLTENLAGSRVWTPVEADFTTGAETHFLLVQLRRFPSRLFENKLNGTAWIGGVSLIPSGAAESSPPKPTQ